MAATELTQTPEIDSDAGRTVGLSRLWLYAYTAVWAATVIPAVVVAIMGQPLSDPVRRLLGLTLSAGHNPAPQLGHMLVLAAHNIPIAAWPLLLGVLDADRCRLSRRLADGLLLGCMIVNVVPVGAALGAYGISVLPYVPQLPLEWGGLALGATGWLAQRQRPLTGQQRLGLFALVVVVLLYAAFVETVAVPHR